MQLTGFFIGLIFVILLLDNRPKDDRLKTSLNETQF